MYLGTNNDNNINNTLVIVHIYLIPKYYYIADRSYKFLILPIVFQDILVKYCTNNKMHLLLRR